MNTTTTTEASPIRSTDSSTTIPTTRPTSRRRARRGLQAALAAAAVAAVLGACGAPLASSDGAAGPVGNPAAGNSSGSVTKDAGSGTQIQTQTRSGDTGGPGTGSPTGSGERVRLHRDVSRNPNPMVQSNNWASMEEFLAFVIHDADSFWTPVLMGEGLAEPQVTYQLPAPGQVLQSACTNRDGSAVTTDDTSMFYCPTDDTIYFSQQLAVDLWNGTYVGPDRQQLDGPGGDMAPAIMVAHEFAHSIQAEVGIDAKTNSVPQREKHADCWAGVWAQNAGQRGLLDTGDVQEIVNTGFLVGDSHFDSPGHHGTPQERIAAFSTGLEASSPIACDIYLQS